jgi:hypothetical protein
MNKMKSLVLSAAAAVITVTIPAHAADVGVSVSVGQPGFYGRIDVGDYPQPALIYREPVIIQRPVGVVYEPLYLHVPPPQAKKWAHYCGNFNACGRPVYFVQDRWYNDVYVPRYHEHHAEDYGRDDEGDHYHGKSHGNWHEGHGSGH